MKLRFYCRLQLLIAFVIVLCAPLQSCLTHRDSNNEASQGYVLAKFDCVAVNNGRQRLCWLIDIESTHATVANNVGIETATVAIVQSERGKIAVSNHS